MFINGRMGLAAFDKENTKKKIFLWFFLDFSQIQFYQPVKPETSFPTGFLLYFWQESLVHADS